MFKLSTKNEENLTLEQKVDLILQYQRRVQYLAIARGVFSLLFFILLVLLPVLGFYYISDYVQKNVGMSFTEIQETIKSGGLEQLKKFMK